MEIALAPDLERFVHDEVERGHYPSASDVIQEALRLLKEQERLREEMRKKIQIGIDEADRGEVAPLDIYGTLANVRSRRTSPEGQG